MFPKSPIYPKKNKILLMMTNQFKSATLLSATHECTPKIWANHERHSFQNWRVKIERHSFLGVSEVKECTLSKSPRIYEILTQILIFFALRTKWNVFNILLLLIIASSVFVQQILIHNRQFKHHIQCTLSLCFTFFKSQCTYLNQNLIHITVRKV